MALFRRTKDDAEPTPEPVTGEPVSTSGAAPKGRPTPKRRQTGVQRGPATPAPQTRKEAVRYQRERMKAERDASGTPQRRRRGVTSEADALPARDRGPVKKLARDWVDSHRMLSNYLIVVLPLLVISFFVPILGLAVYLVLIVVLIEWVLTGRRLRNLAIARDLPVQQGALSLGYYAGTRAYTPRRWRLPRPTHKVGDEV